MMNDFSRQARLRMHLRLPGRWLPLLLAALLSMAMPQIALAAVTSTVVGNVLTVSSDAADPITILCDNGAVKINGADPGTGLAQCNGIIAINVTGGPGDNTIDLGTVTAVDFPTLTSVTLHGEGGNDTITGTGLVDTLNGDGGDDTLVGAKGNDIMNGGPGNDTLIWNNGDNSDIMNGADGTSVNGTPAVVFEGTGANAASIQAKVDEFRNALGANNGVGGSFAAGRREVNWDAIPAAFLDPFPGNFFLENSPRGIEFSTPGTRMKVSGDPATPSFEFADVTALLPAMGLPWGPIEFAAFSPSKMFAPIDSVVTDIHFRLPGTDTPATVTAFGAVLVDVDLAATTRLLFFDGGGALIHAQDVLTAGVRSEGLSFVGVVLPTGKRAARVQLIAGSHPVNSPLIDPPPDGVAIDDVIFAEPTAWFTDTVVVNGAPVGDIFEIAPNGARVAFTRTNLISFTLDINVDALVVNGGEGDDIFNVLPLPATTLSINGGPNATPADSRGSDAGNGDELWVEAQNRGVDVGADSIQVQGAKIIQYTGIERLAIQNRSYSLYLPITVKSN